MKFAIPILLTLCLLIMGQSAHAQAPKNVNVVNTPDVNVIFTPYTLYTLRGFECGKEENVISCYMDVPLGNTFEIEKVTGTTTLGDIIIVLVGFPLFDDGPGQAQIYLIPTTRTVNFGLTRWFHEASGPVYVKDNDRFTDSQGNRRDFFTQLQTDGQGIVNGTTTISVVGRLYPQT